MREHQQDLCRQKKSSCPLNRHCEGKSSDLGVRGMLAESVERGEGMEERMKKTECSDTVRHCAAAASNGATHLFHDNIVLVLVMLALQVWTGSW